MNEVAGRKPIHRKADNGVVEKYEPTSKVVQHESEKPVCPRCKGNPVLKKDCVICEATGKLQQMPFHRTAINPKENESLKDPLWVALRNYFINPSNEKKLLYIKDVQKELSELKSKGH